jgi:hypothetical protein
MESDESGSSNKREAIENEGKMSVRRRDGKNGWSGVKAEEKL